MSNHPGDIATGKLAALLRQAAQRLDASGLTWCVMAGAAATCYGVTRPITDIDLFIRSHESAPILALFPEGQPKPPEHPGEYALDLGLLEIWWGTLLLAGGQQRYPIAFDDAMSRRVTRQNLFGVAVPVMPPEDIMLFKAILQRGPAQNKHDLEDIQAMQAAHGKRLDLVYMKERAAASAALERVAPCLQRLGIVLA